MPKHKRIGTKYTGVFCVDLANGDQTIFIRYKKDRKLIEEKAGRKTQGWTAATANRLRTERLAGKSESNTEKRSKEREAKRVKGNLWTFRRLFEEYLSSKPDLKGRANDERRFKSYLEKDFGNKKPEEITHFDIKRLRLRLTKKKLKPATVRHALEVLRRLSNFAFKHNLCAGIPFVIEMPQVNNIQTEDLTSEQIDKLLHVLNEESDIQAANLVRFALFTGMRRGEIFNLKWSDINFRKKIIRIRNPKGGQDVTIPLNESTEKVLTTHPNIGSDYVFPGLNGGRRNNCTRPMRRIKEKANLPDDFRMFHGLRHVYASQLASSGKVDIYTLQTLLTHKSPMMTQRYAHLRDDTLMQASNVISDLIKQEKEVIEIEQHLTKNSK
jgi:integrase